LQVINFLIEQLDSVHSTVTVVAACAWQRVYFSSVRVWIERNNFSHAWSFATKF